MDEPLLWAGTLACALAAAAGLIAALSRRVRVTSLAAAVLLAPALVERALAEAPWLDTALASDGRPSRHGAAKAQA